MMQMRLTQNDSRLYSPDRDLAHNFDKVMLLVGEAIEKAQWPMLSQLAKLHAITDEELGQACVAVCRFVLEQKDQPTATMYQCLQSVGFFALPEVSRVIVMAYLGKIILGMHFAGVREATLGTNSPVAGYGDLTAAAAELLALMRVPRWRRWLHKLKQRLTKRRDDDATRATKATN